MRHAASGRGSFDDDHPVTKTPGEVATDHLTDPWHEKRKSDGIGQKTGGQQERTGNENHRTVRQFATGEAPVDDRLASTQDFTSALTAHQRGTDDCGHEHHDERRWDPDPPADHDEQPDLDDRRHDEEKEQPLWEAHTSRLQRPVISEPVELRNLPSVDVLARRLGEQLAAADHHALPSGLLTEIARTAIDEARTTILGGGSADPMADAWNEAESFILQRPHRIINATGVLLHTNLGRAPVGRRAAALGAEVAAGYTNLEFDLSTGRRGGRGAYVVSLLRRLTGAEAALVVNNNAGALLLALAAIAGRGAAIVSRGELIEIGGSFRLPLLMEASGARLIEVGTTNRTRANDYEAVAGDAAAILKVHPSNYRIEGFTDEVGYAALAGIAHDKGIPLIADVGSGLLDARTPWLEGPPPTWLSDEPAVRQTLEAGADVVLFSGDKLLGGPQAGIAVGREAVIEAMRAHPIARAVRVDATSLVTLGATLEMYAEGTASDIPFWRMASLDRNELQTRHEEVLQSSGRRGSVVEGASTPGAGSVPGELIPSPVLQLDGSPDTIWKALVGRSIPIVGHRRSGALQLDLRTVDPEDDELVVAALRALA